MKRIWNGNHMYHIFNGFSCFIFYGRSQQYNFLILILCMEFSKRAFYRTVSIFHLLILRKNGMNLWYWYYQEEVVGGGIYFSQPNVKSGYDNFPSIKTFIQDERKTVISGKLGKNYSLWIMKGLMTLTGVLCETWLA